MILKQFNLQLDDGKKKKRRASYLGEAIFEKIEEKFEEKKEAGKNKKLRLDEIV